MNVCGQTSEASNHFPSYVSTAAFELLSHMMEITNTFTSFLLVKPIAMRLYTVVNRRN